MRIFLKLGGSLITEKDQAFTARHETIARIAGEIVQARAGLPDLQLLIGHGSGSFGHFAAHGLGTRDQVRTHDEWLGFQKVWLAARQLNQIIVEEFSAVGLPVMAFPPSASVLTENRSVAVWNKTPLSQVLQQGLIPVIHGDVIVDSCLGGIILSTEELFVELVEQLQPNLILLAGLESGVWQDYPTNTRLTPVIEIGETQSILDKVTSSASIDVTGGMRAKVQLMLSLVEKHPYLQARIFSGEKTGNIFQSLHGATIGTTIRHLGNS